ncbi:MAG: site-specific DNA-methyltransferase [Acidimicrobiia bacterium]|nr:site-specific DNA-methyltransferase [Acidimicrobiia bacterium]
MRERRKTTTSNFGVGGRESHDATAFYDRFRAPEISGDQDVPAPQPIAEPFVHGDARRMDQVRDGSVALVVTSPPYFAGKQYEEELEREGVPSSYLEYLEMLTDVFAECVRKLEPGGRIAVNVANLGRKPYRSLSADVIRIFEHDLGLLLRGELIWQKAEGASGSCAWGSFRSAANPVLRDITERVIIASRGRFDRARSVKQRAAEGLPHESTVLTEDFMALTLDIWSIPPESARRVGHPAPFPVELPEQLIRLYTFKGDLVLDPFMGSGSALVAAAQLGRRYVGYDLDEQYVEISRGRVRALVEAEQADEAPALRIPFDAPMVGSAPLGEFVRRATEEGKAAAQVAEQLLTVAGFHIQERKRRIRGTGVTIDFVAADAEGGAWFFDVCGGFTSHRGGLLRTDTVWKSLGRASALKDAIGEVPLVLLTSHLPNKASEGDTALRAAGPDAFFDAIEMLSEESLQRLVRYAAGGCTKRPAAGFWTLQDLARRAISEPSSETNRRWR